MRRGEYPAVRSLQVDAFGGDEQIGALLDLLRASWAWEQQLSFVSTVDGELAAHALYSHAFVDAEQTLVDVLVLGPVGVHPDHQRRGIGSGLIAESLRLVATRPEPLVFVEGDPRYYGRFGFRAAGELGFRRPSRRIPPAAFQVYRLAGDEPWMRGTLVYPDAFWRADAVGLRTAMDDRR